MSPRLPENLQGGITKSQSVIEGSKEKGGNSRTKTPLFHIAVGTTAVSLALTACGPAEHQQITYEQQALDSFYNQLVQGNGQISDTFIKLINNPQNQQTDELNEFRSLFQSEVNKEKKLLMIF